jgi:phosphoesterase RecJ-like protein
MKGAFRYNSNTTIEEVGRRLAAARRVALTTHQRPDGDALGSILALARVLRGRGVRADLFTIGPPEPNLLPLLAGAPCDSAEEPRPGDDYDAIVVADTGAWAQLRPLRPWLERHRHRVIVLDHHAHGDDVGALRLIDTAAAATTQVALAVIDAMGAPVTGDVAEPLFVGLATDTGWFRFANADARAFADAARLMETGIDNAALYQMVEQTDRPQRMPLAARALSSLRRLRGGAVALMVLGLRDFQETGATADDMSGLVNLPLSVGEVRVSILLTQLSPGQTKISLRSKPSRGAAIDAPWGPLHDVNALAMCFGGGGHVHAAGARLAMDAEAALTEVTRRIEGE